MRPLLFSLLSLSLTLAGCSKPKGVEAPQERVVGTQRAEALSAARLASSVPEYIATVRANEETDFSFKVGGIVELIGPELHRDWDEGTAVKAGAVLARLQQGDFKNALASAKATAELAAAGAERLRKLLANNVVSKQEIDKGQADYDTANAHLRQAEQNLSDSELRAPWDGVVFTRYVNSGETVNSGKPVLRFGDIRVMSVELAVPDRLIGLFTVDKEIDVDISALPGRPSFRGKISEVGVSANNAGRLYRVVIKVPNPDGIIKSGMTATVKAGGIAMSAKGGVLIPLSALIAPSSGTPAPGQVQTELAVFVVHDGKAALRPVRTGDIVASSIIVSEGLQPGEEVVTKGASQLYDGAPVTGH
ncbi:MAG TPA: efflux RND transporter periplasmic adaptor subunit [Chthoniobacterales bacterium]|nr:efflux RND transporter periplasmic adaptor subunit [Chthoniobacterales bacterium]